ncbi:MAG TPA: malto-oligosyltrehalose synthase [Tepidisphaeraceae bacterium]|nr:malto-oligosyltrehalose synthase [Tepidisphaeraceae bacterium]
MPTLDALLEKTLASVFQPRPLPQSTYRLQFHAGFTFHDAGAIVPYLRDLGITHAYASPYLKAKSGSMHGYDVVDYQQLNPELGSEADFQAWVDALRAHGMGHILDMVPNHMGVATNDNAWWNDVLENGPASAYASYFDIDWHGSSRPELQNRLLLPVLGSPYAEVLEKGQLQLAFEDGCFALHYYERRFPIDPSTYECILRCRLDELEHALGLQHPAILEYQSILTAIDHLPSSTECDVAKITERRREKEIIKRRLRTLTDQEPPVRQFIEQNVKLFNGTPSDPRSFDRLDDLLNRQCYRLAYWHVASDEINYRRFFDVNELAALSMGREEVFEATHARVLRLLAERKLDGLRIDHPDGLYDPAQYFSRLQCHYLLACARKKLRAESHSSESDWPQLQRLLTQRLDRLSADATPAPARWPLYVVAEKILASEELLPDTWAVSGTSGYDFLSMVNGLFVDSSNEPQFTRFYQDWVQDSADYADLAYQKKRLILQISLASELHMLTHRLDRLAQQDRHWRDFTFTGLHHALREVIACFPVYRCYACGQAVTDTDRQHIELAIEQAIQRNPKTDPSIFHFIRDVLLLREPAEAPEQLRQQQRRFVGKFQQLTAPVTAKGLEDTAFYVYNRLVSLNEVGGDPSQFGVSPERLHHYFRERQAKWPYSLSALSTHDTKRSEDVRARLNVLSELPEQWQQRVLRWSEMNQPHRQQVSNRVAPHPNEEYLLYQTLLGAWPLEPCSREDYGTFVQRIQAYMLKALREAKVHTRWTDPDSAYESAIQQFIARILDEPSGSAFLSDFKPFQRQISYFGLLNSLSQTLIRLAAPGVPDTYQGTESWNLSLVDPDNRRPVDYPSLSRMLQELKSQTQAAGQDRRKLVRSLLANLEDSRLKLFLTWQALHCRQRHAELFTIGDYIPLDAIGPRQSNLFAFARHRDEQWALVVVPRLFTCLTPGPQALPLGHETWREMMLRLPREMAKVRSRNVLTGEELVVKDDRGQLGVELATVFSTCPVALFTTVS